MKRVAFLTLVILVALCCVNGLEAIHEIIPSETLVAMPGADAEKLNDYIIRFNPYRAWQLWPGKGRLYKGTEPHGKLLTTFVNDEAYRSIKNRTGMAYDSIIVQENYSSERRFDALTVMYRIKGYDPAGGDWFWVMYAPDGKAFWSGKIEVCMGCHEKRKENDYIWTGEAK